MKYTFAAALFVLCAVTAFAAVERDFRPVDTARPRPADFDACWDVTIPSMGEVPVHGYLTVPVGAKPKPGIFSTAPGRACSSAR